MKDLNEAEAYWQWLESLEEHGESEPDEIKKFAAQTKRILEGSVNSERTLLMAMSSLYFVALDQYIYSLGSKKMDTRHQDYEALQTNYSIIKRRMDDIEFCMAEVIGKEQAKVATDLMRMKLETVAVMFEPRERRDKGEEKPAETSEKARAKLDAARKKLERLMGEE